MAYSFEMLQGVCVWSTTESNNAVINVLSIDYDMIKAIFFNIELGWGCGGGGWWDGEQLSKNKG